MCVCVCVWFGLVWLLGALLAHSTAQRAHREGGTATSRSYPPRFARRGAGMLRSAWVIKRVHECMSSHCDSEVVVVVVVVVRSLRGEASLGTRTAHAHRSPREQEEGAVEMLRVVVSAPPPRGCGGWCTCFSSLARVQWQGS